MRLLFSAVRIVLLLTAEVAAVVLLLRLGSAGWARVDWGDPVGWLATAPPGDAVVAVLRLVALAGAAWLAASTALAVAARLSRVPAAVRAVDLVTLPTVRRLADRAVAVALTTGTLVAPAGMAVAAPAPVVAPAEVTGIGTGAAAGPAGPSGPVGPSGASWSPGSAALGGTPLAVPVAWPGLPPAGPSSATAAPTPGTPAPEPVPDSTAPGAEPAASVPPAPRVDPAQGPGAPAAPATEPGSPTVEGAEIVHVVVAGDSLWDLARGRVAAAAGVDPAAVADRDVHAYWVRVLDANRDRIPSSDPDIIRPGDRVVLPATA